MQENQLFTNIKQARSQLNKLKQQVQVLEADPFTSNSATNNNMKDYIRSIAYSMHKNQDAIQKKLVQYGDQRTRQHIQRQKQRERNRLPSIKTKNQHDLSLLSGAKSAYRKHRKHYKHPSQHKHQQSTKIDSSFSLSVQNRPMKIHSTYQKNMKAEVTVQYESQPQIPTEILKLKQQAFRLNSQSKTRKSRQIPLYSQKRNIKYIDLNKSSHLSNQDQKDLLRPPNQVEYDDIVDKYSKHQFMIINGKLVSQGPQFLSYSRIYQSIFTKIRIQIAELQSMLIKKNIKFARFDGKKLAFLCLKDDVTERQLVDCIIDENQQIKGKLIIKNKYSGKTGRQQAVQKIQAFSKMIETRSKFLLLKQKTIILQNFFRKNLNKLQLQRKIHDRNTKILQRFESRQQQLVQNWKSIKTRKRVQIHLNNMQIDEEKRLSIENFGERENIQLARIFRLKDPNLIIIYVSSSQLPPQLISYYHRMLELASIPKYQDRLIFMSPSSHLYSSKLPTHLSISKLLYYSSKTLKQLKIITEQLPTLLYPGQPSNQLIKICDYLQCYLFATNPSDVKMFGLKSQAVRFLKNLSLDVLPSAMQMYDYGEFLNTFAVLIIKNIQIKTWVLKIDDEFAGRGIAYLEVGKSKTIQHMLSKVDYGQNNGQFFATDVATDVATQPQNQDITIKLRDYLKDNLSDRLKIATPTLYRCFEEFMGKFIKKGGIIQAKPPYSQAKGTYSYPSVSFCLFPSGELQITTTYQKIMGAPYRSYACSFPQKCLDIKQVQPILTRICQSFKIRKIFGNFTLDFLHYCQNPGSSNKVIQKIWILGMDPFINNYTASFHIFDVLMGGTFFPDRNSYLVQQSQQFQKSQTFSIETMSSEGGSDSLPLSQRSYIFIPHCHNPQLQTNKIKIKQFFKQARLEQFNFDIANKQGLCVMLLDQLTSGILSLLAVGKGYQEEIQLCKKVIQFVVRITDVKMVGYGSTDLEPSNDRVHVKDMLSLFVSIVRKKDRTGAKAKAFKKFRNNCDLQFIA